MSVKKKKKKGASTAPVTKDKPSTKKSITEKATSDAKKKDEKKKPKLRPGSSVRNLEIKCYAEQVLRPGRVEELINQEREACVLKYGDHLVESFAKEGKTPEEARKIVEEQRDKTIKQKAYEKAAEEALNELEKRLKLIDGSKVMITVFLHNADDVEGDGGQNEYFELSKDKPHFHIYIHSMNRNTTFTIGRIMKMLGLTFRHGLDDSLWQNGVRPIKTTIAAALVYGSHETEKAKEQHKHVYPIDSGNVVTNNYASLKKLRGKYFASLHEEELPTTTKTKVQFYEELDVRAHEAGHSGTSWEDFMLSLPVSVRSDGRMKVIKESFYKGLSEWASENRNAVNKVVIFIGGPCNVGKTYATKKALEKLGVNPEKIVSTSGQGSGKFDDVTTATEALLFDDEKCSNPLNVCEDGVVKLYRRNSGNPYFAGRYIVVTWNESFENWAKACNSDFTPGQIEALKTRFNIFEAIPTKNGSYQLKLDYRSPRGDSKKRKERMETLEKFQTEYNRVAADYIPDNNFSKVPDGYDNHYAESKKPVRKKKTVKTYGANLEGNYCVYYEDGSVETLIGSKFEQILTLKKLFKDNQEAIDDLTKAFHQADEDELAKEPPGRDDYDPAFDNLPF